MKTTALSSMTIHQQMALPLLLHSDNMATSDDSDDEDKLNLGDWLIRDPGATFYTYANGDEFRDQGIADGDLLIIDGRLKPRNGDLVIVSHDDEVVCRQLDLTNCCLTLPASDTPSIRLNDEASLMVLGVVVHVIHTLR